MKNTEHIRKEAINILRSQGTILYPTDTVWGLGCDARDSVAVEKIYRLKNRPDSKSLIVLVSDFEMLEDYLERIPKGLKEFLNKQSRPTSVVYGHPKGFANNTIATNGSIAIRIVQDRFCQEMIREFGAPIVSTSANISGNATPRSFKEISPVILEKVNYVLNLQPEQENTQSSKIVIYNDDGSIEVLRE